MTLRKWLATLALTTAGCAGLSATAAAQVNVTPGAGGINVGVGSGGAFIPYGGGGVTFGAPGVGAYNYSNGTITQAGFNAQPGYNTGFTNPAFNSGYSGFNTAGYVSPAIGTSNYGNTYSTYNGYSGYSAVAPAGYSMAPGYVAGVSNTSYLAPSYGTSFVSPVSGFNTYSMPASGFNTYNPGFGGFNSFVPSGMNMNMGGRRGGFFRR